MTDRSASHGSRGLSLIVGTLLLAEAVVLVIVLAAHSPLRLPVVASLGAEHPVLARIDVGAAGVVLVVIVAVARLLRVVTALRSTGSRTADAGVLQTARWVEYSLTSSITVFLVAQLNGIAELGTLVLAYAITSGMTLFAIVQDRSRVRVGHPLLALCFGSAIGIVPWGVIAFYQVGAGVVGDGPTLIVRVITLVMLAFAAAFFFTQWRELGRGAADARSGERMHVVLSAASVSVFAWLMVIGTLVA